MKSNKIKWELVFIFLVVGVFSVLVAHLISYTSDSLSGFAIAGMTEGSVGSSSYLNCTVVPGNCSDIGFTRILYLYNNNNSHVGMHNTTGFNFSLCCASTISGVTINNTNTSTNTGTYFNFLNLYQDNNSHVEIPNGTSTFYYQNGSNFTFDRTGDAYNISAIIGSTNGLITCNYYENYYGNCSLESETCLVTVPSNLTAEETSYNHTNMHVATCENDTLAYDTSICCELTPNIAQVYINGTAVPEGGNVTLAAMPTNLTVVADMIGGKVRVYEYNGFPLSNLPQYTTSNLSSQAMGEVSILSENTTLTIVPTAGPVGKTTELGEYYIQVVVEDSSGSVIYTQNFNLTTSTLIDPDGKVWFTNRDNFNSNLQNIYSTYTYVKAWMDGGGGANQYIEINGTTSFAGNQTVRASEPTGMNVQVNDDNGNPVNATIRLVETNGFTLFALPQYTDSNVSNLVFGEVDTTDVGVANFTIVQTAGPLGKQNEIGNFSLELMIYNKTTSAFITGFNLTVNKSITEVGAGSPENVPNQDNFNSNLQNFYSTYTYTKGWKDQ